MIEEKTMQIPMMKGKQMIVFRLKLIIDGEYQGLKNVWESLN